MHGPKLASVGALCALRVESYAMMRRIASSLLCALRFAMTSDRHTTSFLLSASYAVFFLSGVAALVYQISWTRQIGLSFGHTAQAAAVVLTTYFAGNAVGYLLGARWTSSVPPLIGYAAAELTVALWAMAIPTLLAWSETYWIADALSDPSSARQATARGVFSFLLLLPATTALGVTLPMMAEFVAAQTGRGAGRPAYFDRVSTAYALNTAGALVGVLAATFFLLVSVGVRTSGYLAAAASLLCAAAALALHWTRRVEQVGVPNAATPAFSQALMPRSLCLALAMLSGFGTLALEVLYTRLFSLVFHNSTYTFGSVVAVFLASLALGAALSGFVTRRFRPEILVGSVISAGAFAILVSVIIFIGITDLDYFTFGQTFAQYLGGALALVTIVVAPPVTLLGMVLPLIWKAVDVDRRVGSVVGSLTAANTLAAAAGALAAGFVLLPWCGLWTSFVVIAASFSMSGSLLLLMHKRAAAGSLGAALFVALAGAAFFVSSAGERAQTHDGETLVRRWNSTYGWIDLVRQTETGSFRVRQNLHYRFGRTGPNPREFRQSHLPLLLHEKPQDVLFLGLGTGLTAGGAIPHDEVKRIEVVELIPEAVEAARALAEHNFGVVEHPKVEVRVDDARHFLLMSDRKYDVIVSDLFVPWESETGYLYTVEHYRTAQRRLSPGGLYCQWLPLYQLGAREFEMIANSFASVFPVTTVWWGDMDSSRPIVALVGTDRPIELDSERLQERLVALRGMTGTLDESLRTSDGFFDAYAGRWKLRENAPLNTDEHPRVEFLTPISNRDHDMISGSALVAYYDRVLSRLPWEGGSLNRPDDWIADNPEQRRARQRFVISGALSE